MNGVSDITSIVSEERYYERECTYDSDGTSFLGYSCLLRVHDIHDNCVQLCGVSFLQIEHVKSNFSISRNRRNERNSRNVKNCLHPPLSICANLALTMNWHRCLNVESVRYALNMSRVFSRFHEIVETRVRVEM